MTRLCAVVCVVFAACVPDERCDDDVDNDEDGLVDCADPSCAFSDACDSCGDGVLDAAEQCDDSAPDADDRCVGCALSGCGNGRRQTGERCDDGNLSGGDGCNHRCQFEECGNGLLERDEECDDGNADDFDFCASDCRVGLGPPTCGDGFVHPLEACDDGGVVGGDGCDAACAVEVCGDGVVSVGEECDDGNTVDRDGCTDCALPRCGDRFVDAGEECDDGGDPARPCSSACTVEVCGDGVVDESEECDEPSDSCFDCQRTRFAVGDLVLVTVARTTEANPRLPMVRLGRVDGRQNVFVDSGELAISVEPPALSVSGAPQGANKAAPLTLSIGSESHVGFVGCAFRTLFVGVPHLDFSRRAETQQCFEAVGADADGDGVDEVYATVEFGDIARYDVSPTLTRVSVQPFEQRSGRHQLARLRDGDRDRVLACDDNRVVHELIDAAWVATGDLADMVVGADLDGDARDEAVFVEAGDLVLNGRRSVSHVIEDVVAGDLDGDGRDDIVISGVRSVTLLLSTRDYAPLPAFIGPHDVATGVAEGFLLLGGRHAGVRLLELRER